MRRRRAPDRTFEADPEEPGRRRPGVRSLAAALSPVLALAALLTMSTTNAAFNALTSNLGNSLSSATVTLADSQGGTSAGAVGTALWTSSTGLVPGSTDTRCIKVTYNGSVTAQVRFYVASGALTGTLGPYLRVSVSEGTVGAAADCSDFGGTVTSLYNPGDTDDAQTLSALAAANTSFASGLSTWQPTGSGQFRTYRITWTVLADNGGQNKTASVAFSWEARNV